MFFISLFISLGLFGVAYLIRAHKDEALTSLCTTLIATFLGVFWSFQTSLYVDTRIKKKEFIVSAEEIVRISPSGSIIYGVIVKDWEERTLEEEDTRPIEEEPGDLLREAIFADTFTQFGKNCDRELLERQRDFLLKKIEIPVSLRKASVEQLEKFRLARIAELTEFTRQLDRFVNHSHYIKLTTNGYRREMFEVCEKLRERIRVLRATDETSESLVNVLNPLHQFATARVTSYAEYITVLEILCLEGRVNKSNLRRFRGALEGKEFESVYKKFKKRRPNIYFDT